jgi:Cerato-platanin
MIYFTTFILALFLSQIAHALPQACGDIITPESPTPVDQFNFPAAALETEVKHNHKYDDPNASTNTVACNNFHAGHPKFHNFPTFPRIGGAFDIGLSPGPHCGRCWKLHNLHNNRSIIITAIDHAKHGFVISKEAFKLLSGGVLIPELKHVRYHTVYEWECGL